MDGFALVIPLLHGTGQSLTETILHAADPQVLYVKITDTDDFSVTSIKKLRIDARLSAAADMSCLCEVALRTNSKDRNPAAI